MRTRRSQCCPGTHLNFPDADRPFHQPLLSVSPCSCLAAAVKRIRLASLRPADLATLRTEVAALQALRGCEAVVQLWQVWVEGLTAAQAAELGLSGALGLGLAEAPLPSGSAGSSTAKPPPAPRSRGRVLLVQEHLPGGELLDHLLRREDPFSEGETRAVLRRLALAVRACHGAGVVHRDIKPENLILRRPGDATSLVLVDFGLAKVLQVEQAAKADGAAGEPGWQLMRTPCG